MSEMEENKRLDNASTASVSGGSGDQIAPVGSINLQDHLPKLDKPWWKYPHFQYLYFCVFLITLTSTNNGYDGSMLNGLQSLDSWQQYMGHPTGHILGALSNGNTFGVILSFPVAPYINDRFGRRIGVFLGQGLCVVGAILQGASTNYAFFLCSRIVLGLGSGIALVGSPTLISEISYPTHRYSATALYNTCWYLGAVVAAWVTYGTRLIDGEYAWRIPSYLQGAIPVFQLALFWLVPESPRYYISRGKIDKAEKILTQYHIGDSKDPRDLAFIQFELNEIQRALELERLSASTNYTDFFTIPSFRRRLFLCLFVPSMMQLSGNGLVSYYLNKVLNSIGITDETKQLEINGCLMIYNMVLSMTAAAVIGFFKRRHVFLVSLVLMLITYVLWTILSALNQQRGFKQQSLANGVLAMIFLYYAAYDIGLNGLPYLFITEILPYSYRAKGLNIFQVTQMIVICYNGFVNPIAMDAIEWKYYIVYDCIIAVELVIVFFTFPETSGYTLEEVAKVFGDGQLAPEMSYTNNKASVVHQEVA